MKLLLTYLILFYSLLGISFAYGVDYNDNIASGNPIESNTQNNIKQSQLIENYIITYKSTIKSLEDKYEIQDSQIIKENINELNNMIRGLKSVQSILVEKNDAKELIKSVVDGLKIVNNNLKPYLKIKQREYENKVVALRTKYADPSKKISLQINALIKSIADPMKKQDRLSNNQKRILKHLIVLEEESKKLSNFPNRSFDTTDEVKSYLRDIIISVRNELQGIKGLI